MEWRSALQGTAIFPLYKDAVESLAAPIKAVLIASCFCMGSGCLVPKALCVKQECAYNKYAFKEGGLYQKVDCIITLSEDLHVGF